MPMVNHDHRIVFFHNPRTGGTSISKHLRHMGFIRGCDMKEFGYSPDQHVRYVPESLKGYFKFCVWRNPYDRFVSLWSFNMQKRGHDRIALGDFWKGHSSDYWLQYPYMRQSDMLVDFQQLSDGFDLPGLGHIPITANINGTKHEDWRSYYDADVAEYAFRKFDCDFDCIQEVTGIDLKDSWVS